MAKPLNWREPFPDSSRNVTIVIKPSGGLPGGMFSLPVKPYHKVIDIIGLALVRAVQHERGFALQDPMTYDQYFTMSEWDPLTRCLTIELKVAVATIK